MSFNAFQRCPVSCTQSISSCIVILCHSTGLGCSVGSFRDSPDWYAPNDDNPILLEALLIGVYLPGPPFSLQIIQAGKRLGWSWCAGCHSCEINWLDPVPSPESDDYETYMEELQRIKQQANFGFYRGYHQPPNKQQYSRLHEDFEARG